MNLQKADIDVARVFLTYLSLQGDVRRTAAALRMEPAQVEALATQESWADKIKNYSALREDDANLQIQLNRSLNYVQARQLSSLIDAVITAMSGSEQSIIEQLTSYTKSGSAFSTKPLTDLVKAAEIVQGMTSRALGDFGGAADEDKAPGGSIGLNVARALNEVAQNRGVDAVTIFQKSLSPNGPDSLPPAPTS